MNIKFDQRKPGAMDPQKKWDRFCKLFDSKFQKRENGCWEWTACVRPGSHPYGKIGFWWNEKYIQLAHRFMWLRVRGELDDKIEVLHKCDNPRCVNPDHLFLGTQQDNVADAAAKKRMRGVPGNKNGAKISFDQAVQIRLASGTQREIATKFGVSQQTISLIRSGKLWIK